LPQPTAGEAPPEVVQTIVVTAQKLANARSEIETRIGATTYTLSGEAIGSQPGGEEIPLNQTLLQANAAAGKRCCRQTLLQANAAAGAWDFPGFVWSDPSPQRPRQHPISD